MMTLLVRVMMTIRLPVMMLRIFADCDRDGHDAEDDGVGW